MIRQTTVFDGINDLVLIRWDVTLADDSYQQFYISAIADDGKGLKPKTAYLMRCALGRVIGKRAITMPPLQYMSYNQEILDIDPVLPFMFYGKAKRRGK
jgi:hypothetical protein